VLFADVVRSMEIAAAVGPERLREIMTQLAVSPFRDRLALDNFCSARQPGCPAEPGVAGQQR
jgi:hypothetical protein